MTSRRKRVIALDGGGVRGIFTMELLRLVGLQVGTSKIHHDCELMVGTSVGALLAAALACNIFYSQAFQEQIYNAVKRVFSVKNPGGPIFAPTYSGKNKKAVLVEIFGSRTMGECECPLAVVTATLTGEKRIFTSWGDSELRLADVLDAASSAPTLFPPVKIGQHYYMDGGVIGNSPVDVAITQLHDLYHAPACQLKFTVLSIGNRTYLKEEQKMTNPDQMGLLAWACRKGIENLVMKVNDDSIVDHMRAVYGEDSILRITAQIEISDFDNVTDTYFTYLRKRAAEAWTEHKQRLVDFFSD